MDLTRRQKYLTPTAKKNPVKIENKINLDLDLNSLNLFCSFIISKNKNIKRSQMINLRNLFEIIDFSTYKDTERLKRIDFIKKGLEARLELNLTDPTMIITHINGGLIDADLIEASNFNEMSNAEIEWVNGTISETLNNSYVYFNIDRLIQAAMDFKTADYTSMSKMATALRSIITDIHTEFRRMLELQLMLCLAWFQINLKLV